MQRKLIVLALVAGASLFAADAARAQYLDSFLDAQRWSNLREHQQEQQKKAQQQHNRAPNAKPVTLAERQAAWSRNKSEDRRRVVRDGQASADRWLDTIVRAGR